MPQVYDSNSTALTEALIPLVGEIDTDETKWRALTAGKQQEELTPETRDRTVKIARYMYLTNPLARRIFDIMSSFTVGGGISYRAKDRRIQEIFDKFWKDPVNRMDTKMVQRARELSIYGELVLPATIHEATGRVRLSWISPIDVETVNVDKQNIEVPLSLTLKKDLNKDGVISDKGPTLKVINYNPETAIREGEVFFYAINKVSDATRGTSDLLPIIDWLGIYDEVMFNLNERVAHMATWLWDVTVAGGTDPEIRKLKRELEGTKIRPGSFRIHNDRISYDPVAPQLVPGNMEEAVKMFKVYILGGAGMPEHFFGEPGESGGRSTQSEMAETAYKMFEERQNYFKAMLTDIFNFVIDQAIAHGMLPKRVDRDFDVILPRVSMREIQRSGGAILRVAQALQIGADSGWIDEEQAQQTFLASIDQIGLGVTNEARPIKRKPKPVVVNPQDGQPQDNQQPNDQQPNDQKPNDQKKPNMTKGKETDGNKN